MGLLGGLFGGNKSSSTSTANMTDSSANANEGSLAMTGNAVYNENLSDDVIQGALKLAETSYGITAQMGKDVMSSVNDFVASNNALASQGMELAAGLSESASVPIDKKTIALIAGLGAAVFIFYKILK